jgi:hypothetical protein
MTGYRQPGTPTITFDIAERTTNVGTTVVTATATDVVIIL